MMSVLVDKDYQAKGPGGVPLWHTAVKRAYRQCQREGWIEKRSDIGRSVADFSDRVDAFGQEWKRLAKAAQIANSVAKKQVPVKVTSGRGKSKTPAWKFCTPALQAILSIGGDAKHEAVLHELESSMMSVLVDKDYQAKGPGGVPLWHTAVKRAYRQCQREGWIEKRSGGVWRITPKGRAILNQKSEGETGAPVTPQTLCGTPRLGDRRGIHRPRRVRMPRIAPGAKSADGRRLPEAI
jgi:DNA-binding transcriptional regulator YhcF (GntR family)